MTDTPVIPEEEEKDEALEAMKLYLRVDHDDEDDLIKSLMKATREYAEGTLCERTFEVQTLTHTAAPVASRVRLPRPPFKSVESVVLTKDDGTTVTLQEAADFVVHRGGNAEMAVVEFLVSLEDVAKVTVQYVAGFDDPPEEYKLWQKLMVAHYFENRHTVLSAGHFAAKNPYTVDYLLQSYRMFKSSGV